MPLRHDGSGHARGGLRGGHTSFYIKKDQGEPPTLPVPFPIVPMRVPGLQKELTLPGLNKKGKHYKDRSDSQNQKTTEEPVSSWGYSRGTGSRLIRGHTGTGSPLSVSPALALEHVWAQRPRRKGLLSSVVCCGWGRSGCPNVLSDQDCTSRGYASRSTIMRMGVEWLRNNTRPLQSTSDILWAEID